MKRILYKYCKRLNCFTYILIHCFIISITTLQCVAQEKDSVKNNPFKFPILLFRNGEYHRSISEIMKLQYQYPLESKKYSFDLYLLKNYYYLSDFNNAAKSGQRIFSDIETKYKSQILHESALFYTKTLLDLNKIELAEKVWKTHWNQYNPFPQANLENYPELLDPVKADLYSSFLPGSGLFYSGEYQKGIVSFFVNAIFITGAYSYMKQNDYGIAGVLMFFELGWYFGGKTASIEAVEKHNTSIKKQYYNRWFSDNLNAHFE